MQKRMVCWSFWVLFCVSRCGVHKGSNVRKCWFKHIHLHRLDKLGLKAYLECLGIPRFGCLPNHCKNGWFGIRFGYMFVFCVAAYTKFQMYGNVGLDTLSFTKAERLAQINIPSQSDVPKIIWNLEVWTPLQIITKNKRFAGRFGHLHVLCVVVCTSNHIYGNVCLMTSHLCLRWSNVVFGSEQVSATIYDWSHFLFYKCHVPKHTLRS